MNPEQTKRYDQGSFVHNNENVVCNTNDKDRFCLVKKITISPETTSSYFLQTILNLCHDYIPESVLSVLLRKEKRFQRSCPDMSIEIGAILLISTADVLWQSLANINVLLRGADNMNVFKVHIHLFIQPLYIHIL